MGRSKKGFFLGLLLVAAVFLTGCTLPRNPVPVDKMSIAHLAAVKNARTTGIRHAADPNCGKRQLPEDLNILALSGGGPDGAFGAGFLCGWTTAARPQFDMVTGISTGALIAPFAFLGPQYDSMLKEAYTTVTAKDVFVPFIMSGESFADAGPLKKEINRVITPQIVEAVGAEHKKGRRLYIGTTNLDSQKLVVWDMGRIASSGSGDAVELFRKILLASSSIPGLFAPVYFEVEADGAKYDEMHADGSLMTSVFGYGPLFEVKCDRRKPPKKTNTLYIIYNGQPAAAARQVKRNLSSIIPRALLTLTKSHAWGDLCRLYTISEKNGIDFNYIGIPDNYIPLTDKSFDKEEMNRLFKLGFEMGRKPGQWRKIPPGFDTEKI